MHPRNLHFRRNIVTLSRFVFIKNQQNQNVMKMKEIAMLAAFALTASAVQAQELPR